jgi:large subunit ribosomal protein L1
MSKKSLKISDLVDIEKLYSFEEALGVFQEVRSNKFDESIDIAINLGIDAGKSDQNVRGSVTLPNSLGKQVTVAAFADGDQANEAKEAGAEFIGMDELAEQFKKGEVVVDVVVATQASMKVVGQLGQILGPKGLMPNPKSGTVTDKIGEAIKNAKSGQVRFKTDKGATIHGCIGKVSYSPTQLEENTKVLIDEVKKLKPASAKGIYIKNVSLSSTMGPGVKLDTSNIL